MCGGRVTSLPWTLRLIGTEYESFARLTVGSEPDPEFTHVIT